MTEPVVAPSGPDPTPAWAPGAASGVGSMPGADPRESVRLVTDLLPDMPYLPELPGRGPGAGLVGRGCALLAGVSVDLQPSGWRVVPRPGMDERRARDLLSRDLDALEETASGLVGPLKLQAAGPWTLAAQVELTRGDKVLRDPVAVRDLTEALAEGLAAHVADVRRRLPGVRLCVQLDEPSLPAVLAGAVRTASGFGSLRTPDEPEVLQRLSAVLGAVGAAGALPLVHCCAPRPPLALLVQAGARGLSLDLSVLTGRDHDAIGEAVEAGVGLLLGLVPSVEPERPPSVAQVADPARLLWARLGLAPELLPATVVVTPTCGLAGASARWARAALELARDAGAQLLEEPSTARRSR